jgi:anti-sigma factor (TIGR02949 family)
MADCNETLRELQRYLDHDLSVEVREAVEAHLGGCVDCLQAYDFHAELKIVISTKCRSEVLPPGLLAKIEACFGIPELDAGK